MKKYVPRKEDNFFYPYNTLVFFCKHIYTFVFISLLFLKTKNIERKNLSIASRCKSRKIRVCSDLYFTQGRYRFHRIGPLGRFGLVVAMSVGMSPSNVIFSMPLIGPQITWSLPRPLIGHSTWGQNLVHQQDNISVCMDNVSSSVTSFMSENCNLEKCHTHITALSHHSIFRFRITNYVTCLC